MAEFGPQLRSLFRRCLRSAKACPTPDKQQLMYLHVQSKFRHAPREVNRRVLVEGEEELDSMLGYQRIYQERKEKERQLVRDISGVPSEQVSVAQTAAQPPLLKPPKVAAPSAPGTTHSAAVELPDFPMLIVADAIEGALGEVLVTEATTVAEARGIIEDELEDVAPGSFLFLSARGVPIRPKQEAKRLLWKHCGLGDSRLLAGDDSRTARLTVLSE